MESKPSKKPDFCGYATKYDIPCTDGRTIMKGAFSDADGKKVPMMWQHGHDDLQNVIGHAYLESRNDGVYARCFLNNSERGKLCREAVQHGDIDSMSIYANRLKESYGNVSHGTIQEISLVLAPANPMARIDNFTIQHSDGSAEILDDEAIICCGSSISYSDDEIEHADSSDNNNEENDDDETVGDVIESMTEKQQNVFFALLADAASGKLKPENVMAQSDINESEDNKEMKFNVFDQQSNPKDDEATLAHSQIKEHFSEIVEDAKRTGSFRDALMHKSSDYGISNIDLLFPDAKAINPVPDFIKRDTDWVAGVLSSCSHTPFSRIKTRLADITEETARAKGYVTGAKKTEEVFKLLDRTTTPTTIYKKQKFDRDDLIDVTDFDVVAWVRGEMRMMLDEELARAILVSDGRSDGSPDKIKEENIRPIWKDDEIYAPKYNVGVNADTETIIDKIIRIRKDYRGSGNPTLYIHPDYLIDMLTESDKIGRRLYPTIADLQALFRVSKIVEVPVFENQVRSGDIAHEDSDKKYDLIGIIVNLKDYTIGADKGGQISMFDDFDIDFNQYKYLLETRCSGALTKQRSALIIEKEQAGE